MAKRFLNPIELPTAVFDGLESVQESGETNMQDHQAVEVIAARLGYPETAQWVHEHQNEYLEGLFEGFAILLEEK
ncbi:MAG: hypothetical protein QOI57_3338 [Rubrobacteraceae bacterium]|jgi:hypothetical protein|nr:hypothetical protein [Rubrobacteraceae bacterium]